MKRLLSIVSFAILLVSGNLFSQDIITLKSGDEVKAKVTEINGTEVKYKKSNNLDGPIYSVHKNEIFMVKYENGEKEMFNNASSKSDTTSKTPIASKTTEDKYLRVSLFKCYEGNTQITSKEFERKIRTHPIAYNQYQSARSLSITGSIFSATGAIIGLIPIFNEEMLPNERKRTNIISWSGLGLGLVMSFMAQSKARKAIDIYNNSDKLSTSLKISSNENGIGLALRF